MATVRILHASDLHISRHKEIVSPIDQILGLRDLDYLDVRTVAKQANSAFRALRKGMNASSYQPHVLKRLAHFIYVAAKRKQLNGATITEDEPDKIDAVLFSGDLATTGKYEDIRKVKDFFTAPFNNRYPYESVTHQATLSALSIPVWYLPGNHDRFESTKDWTNLQYLKNVRLPIFFNTGGTNFDIELIDYLNHPVRMLGEVKARDPNGSELRVVAIAADFSLRRFHDHEGSFGWLAQGKVYKHVLDRLVQVTKAATTQNDGSAVCLIWAVHFPPGFPLLSRAHRLLLDSQLISEANQCGVRAILAGHTHEQTQYRNPKMNFDVFCCGSSTQYVPPRSSGANRFQILNIALNGSNEIGINVEHYKYLRQGQHAVPRSHFYREV